MKERLLRRLAESPGKQGVYYVARFPTRWRLYPFPWEDFGELWHGDAWRGYLAQDLAESWASQLKVSVIDLKAKLWPCHKGFPRGRVERVGVGEFTIFHANDLGETGVDHARVEKAFG